MKRKDFFELVGPLTEKLYRFAFELIPDDLQAEQLVIDSFNAFLIKEKKEIISREVDLKNKKDVLVLRRIYLRGILKYLCSIGARRANQLSDITISESPENFKSFYSLDPKVRMVVGLRYDMQFSVEEIEEITGLLKFEVVEKLHNGRFLLLGHLNQGMISE